MQQMGKYNILKNRGKGYNWDQGKSNNALDAEKKGLFLGGKISKELNCSAEFIQLSAPYEEWHHISGWFNKKRYYNKENVKKWWEAKGKKLWEEEKLKLEANLAKTNTICTVRFNEWLDRKTVRTLECEALIIKQGKRLSTIEIRSDVWILQYFPVKKHYKRIEKSQGYQKGDQITKKIEIAEATGL
jgi:hypothetical protein